MEANEHCYVANLDPRVTQGPFVPDYFQISPVVLGKKI